MTDTYRDPDDRAHEKEARDTNYHDEDQEIQNDEAPSRPTARTLPRRKPERRPPPRKHYHED
jgi:hypothetical protein